MSIVQCQKEKYYLFFSAKWSNNRKFVERIVDVFPTFVGPSVQKPTIYLKQMNITPKSVLSKTVIFCTSREISDIEQINQQCDRLTDP